MIAKVKLVHKRSKVLAHSLFGISVSVYYLKESVQVFILTKIQIFFLFISSPESPTSMVSGVWGRAEKTQSHMPFTDSIHERSGQEGGGLSSKNNNRRPGLGGPAH